MIYPAASWCRGIRGVEGGRGERDALQKEPVSFPVSRFNLTFILLAPQPIVEAGGLWSLLPCEREWGCVVWGHRKGVRVPFLSGCDGTIVEPSTLQYRTPNTVR